MEIVFHFGTSFAQYSIESTTRRIDGAGGKMNSFWAMNSLRMSFCKVPPSLEAGTPCFSATAMYMHSKMAAGELMVIEVVMSPSGIPSKSVSIWRRGRFGPRRGRPRHDWSARPSPGPSAWACRTRRTSRSGRWRAGICSGGSSPRRWRTRRTGASSRAVRGTRWDGCPACRGTDLEAPLLASGGRLRCREVAEGCPRWSTSRSRRRAQDWIRTLPSRPLWRPGRELSSDRLSLSVENLLRGSVRRAVGEQPPGELRIVFQRLPRSPPGQLGRHLAGLVAEPLLGQGLRLAAFLEVTAMRQHRLPKLLDSFLAARHRGQDRRLPLGFGRQAEHRAQLRHHTRVAVEVGLVDDEDVRDLEDPGLDHLHAVSQVRRQDDHRRVRDGGHLEL